MSDIEYPKHGKKKEPIVRETGKAGMMFLMLKKKRKKFCIQILTMLGAAANPKVQQLIFLGLCGLARVIAKPHPQTPPWSCHL